MVKHAAGTQSSDRETHLEKIAVWSLVVGAVFLLSALGRGPLRRLPIGMPIVYLLVGIGIGPWGLKLLDFRLTSDAKTIEVLTEIGVLVSLLTAGLQLTPSWSHYRRTPIPLATIAMVLTIAGVAALGYLALALPLGAAILLGAVLAPTDPVLASDVQVQHKDDRDKLRYSLTGEAGLNDGAAFPFIMLGLGLLGVHDIGDFGWRWITIDLLWAVTAGIVSGWLMGYATSKLAIWVKRTTDAPAACEELLVLALIGLSYGVAMAIHSYGFLAVFAAGVATRKYTDSDNDDDHPDATLQSVAKINEQIERILEVGLVVVIGVLFSTTFTLWQHWWIPLVLFFVIRPLATSTALIRSDASSIQRGLIGFFGIRGIGSVYYLSYAIGEGIDNEIATQLSGIVLTTIAMSLLVHSNLASLAVDAYSNRRSQ